MPGDTTSISSSIASTIGGSAPVGFWHWLTFTLPAPLPAVDVASLVEEHDDRFDALALQLRREALTVSASSRKFTLAMPAGVTIEGVPSSVMPMMPTLVPLKLWMA